MLRKCWHIFGMLKLISLKEGKVRTEKLLDSITNHHYNSVVYDTSTDTNTLRLQGYKK